MTDDRGQLTALALACSLKPSPAPSSSELIAEHVLAHLRQAGVECESVRCVDNDEVPEAVASTTVTVARNAVHLDKVLAAADYPANE